MGASWRSPPGPAVRSQARAWAWPFMVSPCSELASPPSAWWGWSSAGGPRKPRGSQELLGPASLVHPPGRLASRVLVSVPSPSQPVLFVRAPRAWAAAPRAAWGVCLAFCSGGGVWDPEPCTPEVSRFAPGSGNASEDEAFWCVRSGDHEAQSRVTVCRLPGTVGSEATGHQSPRTDGQRTRVSAAFSLEV